MKRLPITDPYLYEYEIHQPQDKDPTLTGRIVAEPYVFDSNNAMVGHGQACSIGTRKTGERRWVGYALFQPIKGDGPEDYIIEDGKSARPPPLEGFVLHPRLLARGKQGNIFDIG